ncbi:PREDICTED: upstream stimulatory factor 1-like isoform X1 [Polistes canadensis]|uniref:upstream stimulatory factor 1-like isoform X1 n=2 Tax=Polistes canadensis TaxID=91411 RepID=UPI000718E04F|nr:PREDICTED: upstream stimulatory factor 1-like isoform X1 [Polistes canadensis]
MEIVHHFAQIEECTDETTICHDNVKMVLTEAEIIDMDGNIEIKSEDDNVQYQLCQINRDESTVAYRVVQVSDNQLENSELSIETPVNNTVQVLTSPLNGQLYLLSNGNEMLTSDSTRNVMPCVAKVQIEASENLVLGAKKRDEKRRATHNEVEKRRRDKINNWIFKLGELIPDNVNGNGINEGDMKVNSELQSKGNILMQACDYITELRKIRENYIRHLEENTKLSEEAKNLRQVMTQLKKENYQLKSQLSSNTNYIGIEQFLRLR